MTEAEDREDRERDSSHDEHAAYVQRDRGHRPPSIGVQQDRSERLALEQRVGFPLELRSLSGSSPSSRAAALVSE